MGHLRVNRPRATIHRLPGVCVHIMPSARILSCYLNSGMQKMLVDIA
jgi:hypothetical protein